MKRLDIYIVLLMLLTMSCKKNEIGLIFGDPNERLADTIAVKRAALMSSPNGWTTIFSPKGGGSFLFYMQFTDAEVSMVSDFNVATATAASKSSYVFRTTGQPSLIFDTYNDLHILSHPFNPVSGGASGQGRLSDYEFYFKSVTADSIVLLGVKNKNIMVLKRATEQQAAFYKGGGIKTIIDEATTALYNKLIHILENNVEVKVALSFVDKSFSLTRKNGAGVETTSSSFFTFAADGLDLVTPLSYEGTSFNKVFWDPALKAFYLTINGKRVPVVALDPPAAPPLHTLLNTPDYRFLALDPPTMPQMGRFNTMLQLDILATESVNRTYNHFYYDFNPPTNQRKDGSDVVFGVTTTGTAGRWIEYNYYKMDWVNQDQGIVRFTFKGNNGSNASTLTYSKNLRAYFESHTFKIDYSTVAPPSGKVMGSFICVEEPDVSFYGRFEAIWSNW